MTPPRILPHFPTHLDTTKRKGTHLNHNHHQNKKSKSKAKSRAGARVLLRLDRSALPLRKGRQCRLCEGLCLLGASAAGGGDAADVGWVVVLPGQGHGDDDEEEKFDVTTLLHPANSNDIEQIEQIGLARLITDTVTFAYLTDVYILPEYQGRGLGAWMMDCVAETLSSANMPHLRRTMLVTTNRALDGGRREDYYAAKFGMRVVGTERREDLGGSTSSSSGDGGGSGMVLSVMSASRRKVATTGDEDKEGAS
ncbi:hypothetical protein T310_1624 [Rasamsonia emersonii CBS 393.64]|uniref:N-acetyltransferase domain-containing protein n=1 Tax=Rasamsonia emersonii (strain ATCC 16479 / CBS 393.64 / IMI 116815) TaxID=1408163 RepID=A0A0F4Z1F7_RASE3|nr:hypothetical protein T310_1624 [Rasamsonia emersonii CBS 393.64]KKA24339.1 hypothetical protein T310_1624 [Rasamsonia emersonii CBS 393.64]